MDDSTPSDLTPSTSEKRPLSFRLRREMKRFSTIDGLIGNYDYGFLFRPNLPFMKRVRRAAPFFGLNDKLPPVLAFLLGLQHFLSMLAGIITPPIIIAGSSGANLDAETTQYLVSTSLIVCGILSAIQITRFRLLGTPYYLGTGLVSVVGTSFAIIPIALGAFSQFYASGYCPTDADGTKLPCPQGYGAILGTSSVCALLEILLSFMPPTFLRKLFPPLVTGPTVALIGVSLISAGFEDWAGGSGPCLARPTTGIFVDCPTIYAPHALPWGSAEFIGLGFSVFVTILIMERFGAPIMKSCAVVLGLLVGCIIAAATGYFDRSGIDAAPVISFIWVKTFPLTVYGPLVLPILAVYIVLMMEAIGDITATCDGGILADAINGMLAGLCTITPMSTFAQNNGVIALTRCASRTAGYFACFFLFVSGLFAKFAAALVAIPSPVLGGMTTFLFASVAVSGLRIIATVPFTRRNRFILTAAFSLGYGATLVPTWFSFVFTYSGGGAKGGLINAVVIVLETGFAVAGFIAAFLNLVLEEEVGEITEAEGTDDSSSGPVKGLFTGGKVDEVVKGEGAGDSADKEGLGADKEEWRVIEKSHEHVIHGVGGRTVLEEGGVKDVKTESTALTWA